jgi:hypothetical protein
LEGDIAMSASKEKTVKITRRPKTAPLIENEGRAASREIDLEIQRFIEAFGDDYRKRVERRAKGIGQKVLDGQE